MVLFLTALRGTFPEYKVSKIRLAQRCYLVYIREAREKKQRRMINAAVALRLTDSPLGRRVLKSSTESTTNAKEAAASRSKEKKIIIYYY